MAGGTIKIPLEELVSLLRRIFKQAGASDRVADLLAANCAGCERDGARSHGIFRMPGYVSSIHSGWVDPRAEPLIEQAGETFLRADARNGFAQSALDSARATLIDMVERSGVALLTICNSHHFSALWPDVEPFAERGLLALSMVNSFACTIGFDGKTPVFGTNPIAFAAPRESAPPLVADFATSAIANGDVQIAARTGATLAPGTGVAKDGAPTIDSRSVLDGGALLTFGGYKGSALSMMIELFVAALSGGHFSFEVDWSAFPGAQTPRAGQVMILIDPDRGRDASFSRRASVLAARLYNSGVSRLPGDRRRAQRERSLADGIEVSMSDWEDLSALVDIDSGVAEG